MNLSRIRKKIDFLDSRIVNLLRDRMELALLAKKFKSQIEDRDREKELLERIRNNSTGLIDAEFIEKVYVEILKESKNLQQKDYGLIAFQGEHGGYGEIASRHWNNELVPVPCSEFAKVFEGVESGLYGHGIVPIENTLGGVIGEVNQLLINTELDVVGAVELPIHHCLLVVPGTDYGEIRAVYSHPYALAQCRNFLASHKLEPVQYHDAAGAAKMLAETTPKACGAIATRLSAELYNLEVMKADIDDLDTNMTRFLVLSKEDSKGEGDKCSAIFSAEHKAGTLFNVLEVFANANINLTRIESIPGEPGNYVFFLDFIGSKKDEKVLKALEKVKQITPDFKLKGCYTETRIT